MVWYIIAAIAAAIAVAILLFTFVRDRLYLKKRGLDYMGPELRGEVEEERAASMERRERFRDALDGAMEKDIEKDRDSRDAVP